MPAKHSLDIDAPRFVYYDIGELNHAIVTGNSIPDFQIDDWFVIFEADTSTQQRTGRVVICKIAIIDLPGLYGIPQNMRVLGLRRVAKGDGATLAEMGLA